MDLNPTNHSSKEPSASGYQPRALFLWLLVRIWWVVSVGSLLMLILGFPQWQGLFQGQWSGVALEHWLALGLILVHPLFYLGARWYRRVEPVRAVPDAP